MNPPLTRHRARAIALLMTAALALTVLNLTLTPGSTNALTLLATIAGWAALGTAITNPNPTTEKENTR